MKQGVTGSGSTANTDYPETAAANADLEAKLTGGGQHGAGGGGSAMPNEAQVPAATRSYICMHACTHAMQLILRRVCSSRHGVVSSNMMLSPPAETCLGN